jgi:hypothetical protein
VSSALRCRPVPAALPRPGAAPLLPAHVSVHCGAGYLSRASTALPVDDPRPLPGADPAAATRAAGCGPTAQR